MLDTGVLSACGATQYSGEEKEPLLMSTTTRLVQDGWFIGRSLDDIYQLYYYYEDGQTVYTTQLDSTHTLRLTVQGNTCTAAELLTRIKPTPARIQKGRGCYYVGHFWAILRAAAGQILYLALHLESGSFRSRFPRQLSVQPLQPCARAVRPGGMPATSWCPAQPAAGGPCVQEMHYAATSNQDDLISIGTIGLIKAVDTFDPDRASKFASYASRCIENELRMELRKIRREGAAVSLQEPLESGSGQLTLADTLPDDTVMEDDCERRADAARLRRLVDTLPARERALLQLRYGLGGERPATQQQTADKLGISRSYNVGETRPDFHG